MSINIHFTSFTPRNLHTKSSSSQRVTRQSVERRYFGHSKAVGLPGQMESEHSS